MKQKIALSLCLLMILCAAFTFSIQPTTEQTEYYASDFNGASDFTDKEFTVEYTQRTPSGKSLALRAPDFIVPNVTCVPIAGANLLGFYDRFCTELIPNFTPGVVYAGIYYVYNAYDNNVTNAALQLSTDMGLTDPAHQGATVSGFKSGFNTYCNRQSYAASFTSVMNNKSFSYDAAKAQINSGKPVILFCSEFNFAALVEKSNADRVVLHTCKDPHAMVAFGYTEYTYTLSNGSTRVDKYLNVATGVDILTSSKFYMGSDISIDDAYAVNVY